MMAQEEFKRQLHSKQMQLHKRRLADVEEFVRQRTDGPDGLKLPSLAKLTCRDLQWLAAAIDNC